MRAAFHAEAQTDYKDILIHLESISEQLSDKFQEEFRQVLAKAKLNPYHYHFLSGASNKRRANIKSYQHHFIYEVDDKSEEIRILVIRHDKRHPAYGLHRSWPQT